MKERDAGQGKAKTWNGPDLDADYGGDIIILEERVKEIFAEFLFTEPDAPHEARIMESDHVLTQEEIDNGGKMPYGNRTHMQQAGTRFRHWISCIKFAMLFYEVLSDPEIPYDKDATAPEKDRDVIAYLMKYDEIFNLGHARYLSAWREEGRI